MVIDESAAIASTARIVFLNFMGSSFGARDVVIVLSTIVRDFV
jgi:hypothetical protein